MKANKFMKEHGLQYTRNLVRDYPNHTHVTDDGRMFINENTCVSHIKVQLNELVKMDDLKRLVESHRIVESYGGIDKARDFISPYSGEQLNKKIYSPMLRTKQAIADVESCLEADKKLEGL
ncbi:hypothetical protein ACVBEE_00435 [Acinetobacter sp. ANC 3781]